MPSVLIADDHAPTRELLVEKLGADGYEVRPATDASTGFEHFAHDRPDIVLVALALPTGDGPHLAERIRASDQGTRIPMIVYDAAHLGRAKGIQAILDLGANAYLPDPTKYPELRARIEQLLRALPAPEVTKGPREGGEAPEPVAAQGDVEQGVLAGALVDAFHARFTGVLVLDEGHAQRTIHLLEGLPTAYRSSMRSESLSRWLVERGDLEDAAYGEVLEVMAHDGLSETGALVATGALEAGAPVYDLLKAHAQEMILRAFGLKRGRYRLVEGRERALEAPALELPGLSMVLAGARRHYPVSFLRKAMEGRMDAFPYRVQAFGDLLSDLGLAPSELAFALKITGDKPTRDLVTGAGAGMKEALLLLWYLSRVEVVRFDETAHESEDAHVYETATSSARKKKPLPPDIDAALRDEAVGILTSSYFGALGLDIAADVEDVERAFHEAATRFHPETYEAYDVSGIADLLQTVLDKVNAAYRVLCGEEKRRAYLSFLLSRHETTRRKAPIEIDAEIAMRRGTRFLDAGDMPSAQGAFEQAISLNPREPEFYCHLAFTRLRAERGPLKDRVREAKKLIKKALSLEPELEHAEVIMGLIEQADGDRSAARKRFLKVLKKSPDNALAKAALKRLDHVPG